MNQCGGDVTLFVKAGRDGRCFGACHQSQRVLMMAELKATAGVLPHFKTVPVNIARPPEIFRSLGLRLRVPALNLGSCNTEPVDVADDIVTLLELHYPGGILQADAIPEAEIVTRDFFSKFCFYIRDVSKDSSQLETELCRIDNYLASLNSHDSALYLCGSQPSLLDCEVLPKLHQVRVAAAGIKGYSIPASLTSLWRYLHTAYSEAAFTKSCPSDAEILVHWLEHIGEAPAAIRKLLLVAGDKTPQFSFSVPVYAKPVMLE